MPRTQSNPTVKHIKARRFDLVTFNDAADRACTPLYTPVSRIPAKKVDSDETHLVKNIKTLLKSDPKTDHLVPYARDGFRLFNYLFDATRAAEKVEIPVKGFTLLPAEVETTTERGYKVAAVSELIGKIVKEQLDRQDKLEADEFSYVPWFGNDTADEHSVRLAAKKTSRKRKSPSSKSR